MKRLNIAQRCAALVMCAGLGVTCSSAPDTSISPTAIDTTTTTTSTTTAVTGAFCATGDGVNDAAACEADARTYCAGFYGADWQAYARANGYTTASWKYGLLDCLGKHNVSVACANSLDRRELLNAQMMNACRSYCRGTSPRPGAEPCVDHLKSIYGSLNDSCRSALDAHEAAKAVQGSCLL